MSATQAAVMRAVGGKYLKRQAGLKTAVSQTTSDAESHSQQKYPPTPVSGERWGNYGALISGRPRLNRYFGGSLTSVQDG